MTDSNRTVLITGAAQGLGRAMSVGLLERGFSVAAVDRDSNGLSALREQIAAGPKFEGFVAD
jgi:NAD(P)-dependent dehydrogenase (short-subunit alcohol dehydrogenase family)